MVYTNTVADSYTLVHNLGLSSEMGDWCITLLGDNLIKMNTADGSLLIIRDLTAGAEGIIRPILINGSPNKD